MMSLWLSQSIVVFVVRLKSATSQYHYHYNEVSNSIMTEL